MKNPDVRRLELICEKIFEDFPEPKTELDYKNEFTLLIAIILSAQNTDRSVNLATREFFEKFSTPQELLNLGIDEAMNDLKTINYYKNKTKYIFETAKILIEKYNSKIPSDMENLLNLKGVGRKTANVFLNIAHEMPTIAVDTHVLRVTNRIFGKIFTKPDEVEEFLLQINLHENKILTHHLLVLHGRYICKAKKPDCENCSISDFCKSKR